MKKCTSSHTAVYANIKVSRILKTKGVNSRKVEEKNQCSMEVIAEHFCKCAVDV